MTLIAVEGADGSGKSTQVRLLAERLRHEGANVATFSFPQYGAPHYGRLISMYLRGELGELHPYAAASFFAEDRRSASIEVRRELFSDVVVIADRYIFSNIAYQVAREYPGVDPTQLAEDIWKMEVVAMAIPPPDVSICLATTSDDRRTSLTRRIDTHGAPSHLGGESLDVYEKDEALQDRAAATFVRLGKQHPSLELISCYVDGVRLTPGVVHEEIMAALRRRGLVS